MVPGRHFQYRVFLDRLDIQSSVSRSLNPFVFRCLCMKLHKILYASALKKKKRGSLFSLAKEAIPEKCTLLSSSKIICFSMRRDLFVLYQGLSTLVTGLDFFHFLCLLLTLVPAFSSDSSGTVFFFIVESTLIVIHCSLR